MATSSLVDTTVRAQNLTVSIGSREIIHDVSFEIPQGDSLALVGESGSGKTVTSRVFTGLLTRIGGRVTSGEAMIAGQNVAEFSDKQWDPLRGRIVSLVPQASLSGLDPVKRIGKQMVETIKTLDPGCTDTVGRARELLDQVRLKGGNDLLRKYPHELSGGMRQRVMIALALVAKPQLMVADEPTTALDVTVQREILRLLGELRAENNMSLLLIAHDLAAVSEVCENVAVMNQGRIVEIGRAADVLVHPVEPYTQALIAARPENSEPGHPLPVLGSDGALTVPQFDVRGGAAAATSEKDDVLVQMSNISMQYRGTTAPSLYPDDLTIKVGDSLGIVGESGSGKSTLGRILVGALKPTTGHIVVDGQDWSKLKRTDDLRRDVQMVFQDPYGSLTPWCTPRQIVSDVIRRWKKLGKNEANDAAGELLREVGLPDSAIDRRTSNLSGGQCQRAGIARALAAEPQLLVADEPTSSLDVSIQAQILNLLLELRYLKDFTLVLISHDLGVIRHMTEQAIVLKDGRIVERGSTRSILESPQDPYTKELVAATPTITHDGSK